MATRWRASGIRQVCPRGSGTYSARHTEPPPRATAYSDITTGQLGAAVLVGFNHAPRRCLGSNGQLEYSKNLVGLSGKIICAGGRSIITGWSGGLGVRRLWFDLNQVSVTRPVWNGVCNCYVNSFLSNRNCGCTFGLICP